MPFDAAIADLTLHSHLAVHPQDEREHLFVAQLERVAPAVVLRPNRVPALCRFAFRTVSQLALNYRGGPPSQGRAGRVGDDRLPWTGRGGPDDHAPLSPTRWQVHVYGEASTAPRAWCDARGMALRAFARRSSFRAPASGATPPACCGRAPCMAVASRRGIPADLERFPSGAGLTP